MGINALIQKLGAPVQEIRDRSTKDLIALGEEAVAPLVEALSSEDRNIRSGAALCLGGMGATQAAGLICKMAEDDPDLSVRPLALRAIVDLAGPDAPALIKRTLLGFLSSEDIFVRALACKGIGQLGDPGFKVALNKALQDSEEWVREAAQAAMVVLLDAAIEASPSPTQQPTASTALISADDHQEIMTSRHVAQLGSHLLEEQQAAKTALLALGERALEALLPLLSNELAPGRPAAVEVVGGIGSAAGMPHLVPLLEVRDLRPTVLRSMSMILLAAGDTALEAFPAERAQAALRDDPDQLVRAAAAAALIAASPRQRRLALEITARDDDEWVLVSACAAAASQVGPEDRDAVSLLLDHLARLTEQDGRVQVLLALDRILVDPLPEDQKVVGPLSYFLHEEDHQTRLGAGLVICRVAREVDGPTLMGLLDLIPLAEKAERLSLIQALGRLGWNDDSATLEGLGAALYGRDPEAARAAARSLLQLGGTNAIDVLVAAANSRQGQVVAIAAQELAAMDPRGGIVGVRNPNGSWERRLQHWCECGGELRWISRGEREQLRCPACDREHIVSQAGKLYDIACAPLGACCCPECRRRQPLIRQGTKDTLICPSTAKVHVRPFDHLSHVRLLTDLPLGACVCCAEPQPLIRVDEQVVCYRSRRPYRAEARGFVLEVTAAGESATDDVAAINQALLAGTIGIGQSGVAVGRGEDEES
jgi:HEAT repeat protein